MGIGFLILIGLLFRGTLTGIALESFDLAQFLDFHSHNMFEFYLINFNIF